MLQAFFASLETMKVYTTSNLTCLTYGPQVLVSKSLLLTSYFDLLADLSEAFGV